MSSDEVANQNDEDKNEEGVSDQDTVESVVNEAGHQTAEHADISTSPKQQAADEQLIDRLGAEEESWEADYQCYDEEYGGCDALSHDFFGRQLSCTEIGALVGAPADAQVRVRCGTRYIGLSPSSVTKVNGITIVVTHRFYQVAQKRVIFKEGNGALVLFNEIFVVNKDVAPAYTGTRVLAHSVQALLRYNQNTGAKHRIRRIRTHAFSASDAYNGAYTWARLGFNSDLERISSSLREKLLKEVQATEYSDELRQAMGRVENLNDLILAGGAELWRKNYEEFWGDFDLNPNLDSISILFSYIEKNGVEL